MANRAEGKMVTGMWLTWTLIIVLTIVSGIGDAYGFTHAARIWQNGRAVWAEVAHSAVGFAFGIALYWYVLKYMSAVGIVAPEIQTIAWFAVTIIGVALISGQFLGWNWLDQLAAVVVLAGIGWLLVRTGG
jgi:hypothetical protein